MSAKKDITEERLKKLNCDEIITNVILQLGALRVSGDRGKSGNCIFSFLSRELQHAQVIVYGDHGKKITLEVGPDNDFIVHINDVESNPSNIDGFDQKIEYCTTNLKGKKISDLIDFCNMYAETSYNSLANIKLKLKFLSIFFDTKMDYNQANCQTFADDLILFLTGQKYQCTILLMKAKMHSYLNLGLHSLRHL